MVNLREPEPITSPQNWLDSLQQYAPEFLQRPRVSSLDVYEGDPSPGSASDYYAWIEARMQVIDDLLHGEEHKTQFPTESSIGEVFVNEKTGLVSAFILMPSQVSRTVGANIVTVAFKPETGTDEWMRGDQQERSNRLIEHLPNIEAIVWADHGLGASEATNAVIVDGLASGELIDPVTQKPFVVEGNTLFALQLSKGAGGTLRKESRSHDYTMSTGLAQMVEAMAELDLYLTDLQLQHLASSGGRGRLEQIVSNFAQLEHSRLPVMDPNDPRNTYVKEVLRIGELKAGTWFANRVAVVEGHSMAGWEGIREYLANYFGRIPKGFAKYVNVFCEIAFRKAAMMRSRFARIDSQKNTDYGIALADLDDIVNGLFEESKQSIVEPDLTSDLDEPLALRKLGQIRLSRKADFSVRYDKPGTEFIEIPEEEQLEVVQSYLQSNLPNPMYQAKTPVVIGAKADDSDKRWVAALGIDPKRHTLLINAFTSPKFSLLIALERAGLGNVGFKLGDSLGWVKSELESIIPENAFGRDLIRAAHYWGIATQLPTVEMNAGALEFSDAVVGQDTGKMITSVPTYIIAEKADGKKKIMPTFKLHVWTGGKDKALQTQDMTLIAAELHSVGARRIAEVHHENADSGHYLQKVDIEAQQRLSFGRIAAIRYHRNMTAQFLANKLFSSN